MIVSAFKEPGGGCFGVASSPDHPPTSTSLKLFEDDSANVTPRKSRLSDLSAIFLPSNRQRQDKRLSGAFWPTPALYRSKEVTGFGNQAGNMTRRYQRGGSQTFPGAVRSPTSQVDVSRREEADTMKAYRLVWYSIHGNLRTRFSCAPI